MIAIALLPLSPLPQRLVLIALVLMAVNHPCWAEPMNTATLSVRGESHLEVEPDRVSITLGVTSVGPSVDEALQTNNTRMQQLIAALGELGLTDREVQTRQFSVRPMHSQRPRDPAPGWQSQITGYRVSNSLTVQTLQLELISDIISSAGDTGANEVSSLQFDLSSPRQHREAAIKLATENARQDAQSLASAAGTQLKRVISLKLDHADASPIVRTGNFFRAAQDAASPTAPPIQAGDVSVRATVLIQYQLEQQE